MTVIEIDVRQLKRDHYHMKRDLVLFSLGSKCVRCGFDDKRALQVDHVNGGGSKLKGRGINFWNHVLKNTHSGLYQLLCANCNWIKRNENNEHNARKSPIYKLRSTADRVDIQRMAIELDKDKYIRFRKMLKLREMTAAGWVRDKILEDLRNTNASCLHL